ncbi:DUF7344 domain-containing protein [Haloprofundus salinisoli]|uniref:DUF7344 domain-containing protein n=1 Tax=Haloprofundus salinisoli TaxID=2876193 RepID=UPI001CCF309D|nr:hypothetical protein [Haloprofundus salinisoli]
MTDEHSSTTSGGADELPRLLAALSHPRRRQVVTMLSDGSQPSTLAELVAAIRAPDSSASAPGDHEASLDSLGVSLHHVHLPKLTDAGFVEYDPVSRTLAPGPRLTERDTEYAPLLADRLDDEPTDSEACLFATPAIRAVLTVLDEAGDAELAVSSVATALSAHVGGSPRTHTIRLRHSLLPKLAETGVVDYDTGRETVSLRHDLSSLGGSSSPAHP